MIEKLYVGAILAAAVLGVATSSIAGPGDCASPGLEINCDQVLASDLLVCSFLAEHGADIAQQCQEAARAQHFSCKMANNCSF